MRACMSIAESEFFHGADKPASVVMPNGIVARNCRF